VAYWFAQDAKKHMTQALNEAALKISKEIAWAEENMVFGTSKEYKEAYINGLIKAWRITMFVKYGGEVPDSWKMNE